MSNSSSPFKAQRTEAATLQINRRRFIYSSALAASALAIGLPTAIGRVNYKSPNEKLNIGGIGVGGRGAEDVHGLFNGGSENVIALCDVDEHSLNAALEKYPGARPYRDYRKMLEAEKSIDAVNVSIPDHQHAPATMLAMSLGKHVYTEKPLTHTIWEARQLRLAARKYKVATQMGNQGHCGEGNRQLCEMIGSGVIGPVREVHCWTDRSKGWWPQGLDRPPGSEPVPGNLEWDLWLGPAPERPYVDYWPEGTASSRRGRNRQHVYCPFTWRGWWDFGCGALGDMGCHIMDGPNWALKLDAPVSVELVSSSQRTLEMAPVSSIIRYEFAARSDMPACTLTWYDAGQKPPRPPEMEADNFDANGSMFIGDNGKIIASTYGERPHLLPESRMAEYKRPAKTIPRVPGNSPHQDFIRACKGGPPACSNFDVSGPFTEWVVLGNLAIRVGGKLEWDAKPMKVKNLPQADSYIHKHYRPGWKV